MAVEQKNKAKTRPVMDYRYLNTFLSSHTAEADVCGEKLRDWRRMGNNAAIIDLRKAYLQIHVDKELWPYQVVYFEGRKYCLTRLGFGLCVAPKVMTLILRKVLGVDKKVSENTDSYIDDIFVNMSNVSCEEVVAVLDRYGLKSKPFERLEDCRVLGLRVKKKGENYWWTRDNSLPSVSEVKTRRDIFSFCGRAVGHYPCAAWLRPACSYIKRSCNGTHWDDSISSYSQKCLEDVELRLKREDPVCGRWDVPNNSSCVCWCDASSLAIGVVIEIDGIRVEDQSWLRPVDDGSHINVAELESVLKGISLAVSWSMKRIKIMTDSSSVFSWITSVIVKDHKVKAKGLSEVLIRRRLSLIKDTISECDLALSIHLVPSSENKADELTRVPSHWLRKNNLACVSSVDLRDKIARIHNLNHFGVDRTFYFVKRAFRDISISKKDVANVVRGCRLCLSIDPSPVRWPVGRLSTSLIWSRVACDVTHHDGVPYLSFIDCGPSRFTIWKRLHLENANEITNAFNELCIERGPPAELLVDNGAVFHSAKFCAALNEWCVNVHYRNAYRPSGNGIVERIHRTVKHIAARSKCSILKATYWYNVSPKSLTDTASVPSNQLFQYSWRCVGVDPKVDVHTDETVGTFVAGRQVFVKPPNARCSTTWNTGTVTRSQQGLSVEVDGVPRHIADVRLIPEDDFEDTNLSEPDANSYEEESQSVAVGEEENNPVSSSEEVEAQHTAERRSGRVRVRPAYLNDYVTEDSD